MLARLNALPITKWSYKAKDCSVRHMGPTGQDFAAAFETRDGRNLIAATVDADGVALPAIHGLCELLQERKRVAELEAAKN